jgi:hypothetical protein
MGDTGRRLARSVWNGPFYIGPLARPVSVGEVLLKLLETLWRAALSIIVLVVIVVAGVLVWVQFLQPALFPALASQIIATASFDDGTAPAPPSIGEGEARPFRCSPDYPVKILFQNTSDRTVRHLSFSIRATESGQTGNLVTDGEWREANSAIPAGYTWSSCWSVSVLQGLSSKDLIYAVEIRDASEVGSYWRDTASMSTTPLPAPTPTPLATNAPNPALALTALGDAAWGKMPGGCACWFSEGAADETKLIASGGSYSLFQLNGDERLCSAPSDQELFDGPVSLSCDNETVLITPFGEVEPGGDGHSSPARLRLSGTSGTLNLTGRWSCGC